MNRLIFALGEVTREETEDEVRTLRDIRREWPGWKRSLVRVMPAVILLVMVTVFMPLIHDTYNFTKYSCVVLGVCGVIYALGRVIKTRELEARLINMLCIVTLLLYTFSPFLRALYYAFA